ncbi:MAG: NADH:ubiquinone reductase (Na(+)-transporting) subunit A, partial [Pseudomonadota bacterium]
MKRFAFRKGLRLPISGEPSQDVENGLAVRSVGLLGDDYLGLKPRLSVDEGDPVGPGSPIFNHKDLPDVQVVSPVAGRVKAINRGARRKLISVEIDVGEGGADPLDFSGVGDVGVPEGIVQRLCAAGLWTSFRTRPYSRVPDPQTRPAAIYVTAMDTEPLAADPAPIIQEAAEEFSEGLKAIATLSEGVTYLCHAEGADLPGGDLAGVEAVAFEGPHPAGLAGTHMHFLEPPGAGKTVWTIGYQDVIMIGRLMRTGRYDASCVVALSGPVCAEPRMVRTVAGASMIELTARDIPRDRPVRMISGSVLSGRAGEGVGAYLGRYARQITLIEEDREQIPMGWIRPMPGKFAVQPVLGSAWMQKLFPLTSNLNGGR